MLTEGPTLSAHAKPEINNRRFLLFVIVILAIWQAFPILYAIGSHFSGVGQSNMEFGSSHTILALSLIQPTTLQVAEAWHTIYLVRDQQNRAYDSAQRKYQPSFAALTATQSPDSELKFNRAKAFIHLHMNRDWEGCEFFLKSSHPDDHRAKFFCGELMTYSPPDFSIKARLRRFDLLYSFDFESGELVRQKELWDIFDECKIPQQLIPVLSRLRKMYGVETSLWRKSLPCSFNTAVARVNAAWEGDRDTIGQAITVLADASEQEADMPLAIFLYTLAMKVAPFGSSFGHCTFSRGHLLRDAGFSKQSILLFAAIFPSSANDQDRGQHLMVDYRKYRYRAAKEIAAAYADMHNYPLSYYYSWISAYRYEYRSWDEDAAMRKRLINTSLAAGPLFAIANIVGAPITNWRISLVLAVIYWGFRRLARHRLHASAHMYAGTGN